jgi:hypothetical protein
MTVWYSLWSFGIFFPIWYVWTMKNLATLRWSKSMAIETASKSEDSVFKAGIRKIPT